MQPGTAANVPIFRELESAELAEIFAHDLEQAIISLLATEEFKQNCIDWFLKSGRFGSGACFPVVFAEFKGRVKVYASVEAAQSKERMPAPFTLDIAVQTGTSPYPTDLIHEAENVEVQRVVGIDVNTAVDRARIEVGIPPLVPQRTPDGSIVNQPGNHADRKSDYAAGELKRKNTLRIAKENVAKRAAAKAAEAQSEEQRLRAAAESEARSITEAAPPESGIK